MSDSSPSTPLVIGIGGVANGLKDFKPIDKEHWAKGFRNDSVAHKQNFFS
jgi:hypothetical protein